MRDRGAEDGHDRVADELLDRAAVALDDPLHPLEVTGEKGTEPLRVERLAERSRAGYVAEENGDGLPLLTGRRDRSQLRAAVGAKGEVSLALAPTAGADRHPSKVKPAGTTTTARRLTAPSICRQLRPVATTGLHKGSIYGHRDHDSGVRRIHLV